MSVQELIREAHQAGVELRLVDGKLKATGTHAAVALMIEPLRQHKADLVRWFIPPAPNDPEPSLDRAQWLEIDREYQRHHWKCPTCQAAGRGARYGLRCGAGAALWRTYSDSNR